MIVKARKRICLLTLVSLSLFSASLASGYVTPARCLSGPEGLTPGGESRVPRSRRGRGFETHREMIEKIMSVSSGARIKVDPGGFGNITVTGWDPEELKLVAEKETMAVTQEEARALASQVQILIEGGGGAVQIRAEGPKRRDKRSWSVSFQLFVPRRSDLDLRTKFGRISIENIHGDVSFTTEFGDLALSRVSGTVVGQTQFGKVDVELSGERWEGERLDVATKFGGVTAHLSKSYSAELETGTSFGSLEVDFPITIQGRVGNEKRIKARLGVGGAPIRLVTDFGDVSIKAR